MLVSDATGVDPATTGRGFCCPAGCNRFVMSRQPILVKGFAAGNPASEIGLVGRGREGSYSRG
jgi:hypothetical protein